ncbi:MAG: nucleotide sugar dehydrogenase [Gilvibacter sp.]
MNHPKKIGIIGLGYVGLPLAVAFAKHYEVIGFDINPARITALNKFDDQTLEVASEALQEVMTQQQDLGLTVTTNPDQLATCSFYIVTVPTPIDEDNNPDLTPLIKASEQLGVFLKKGDTVVFESTVYPGVTEELCAPILERVSGLTFNKDFYAGYSPERINPGDKKHTVTKILKITSGSTPEIATLVNEVYAKVITAGTYMAPSIKVAEAAKVIENSQRDINIAFVNELSKIFRLLEIDTQEVLEAAATKWNFIKFTPGLVGGHCIGVDPYYLAQKALDSGYNPEIILAGRRMNDGMGAYVAKEVVQLMINKQIQIKDAKALVLGLTFKENCPDVRNSQVFGLIEELKGYHMDVEVCDPWVDAPAVKTQTGQPVTEDLSKLSSDYDLVILAVAHKQFGDIDVDNLASENAVIFDVKSILPKNKIDGRL